MAKKQVKKQARKLAKKPVRRARKPAVRKARARTAPKPLKRKKITRKVAAKAVKAPARKATRKVVRKVVRKVAKAAPRTVAPNRKVVSKTVRKVVSKTVARKPLAPAPKRVSLPPPAALQRPRRRLSDANAETFIDLSEDSRLMSSARAGHDELRSEMLQHTEASPELTAGDVDAKWQDAYALGDEAPGGDNMTPDQDRVDDIGKALGIEYADDEELMGGEEVTARDEHRWELDPASKEDEEE